ncbi:MAG: uracil-DNA glycosylase, partial [Gemmatimonadetes bacterium]|nr:uracil-DNA glycosylase [Gemmatimonadota bacterium]
FTGDASGDWLYQALHRFGFASQPTSRSADDGLTLIDCYITAAARCAPPGNQPARQELDTCRPYLEREVQLLPNVRVVLALGRIGHEAWLRASGRVTRMPDGLTLVCTYHPSRQNTNTGKLTRRMWHGVFRRVRRLLDEREE